MAIKIVCDAVSNLFKNILQEKNLDVKVMPLHLTIGDKEYNCYDDDLDIEEFSKTYYEMMDQGIEASTSLVNPQQYIDVFEEEVNKGNQVICFTMAKGISGTYNSAVMAMNEINDKYQKEMVYVIDTMTAGLGEGLQVIHADSLVKAGKSFAEVKKECEQYKLFVRSDFTVGNVKYLIKTGRASKALAKFVNFLKIKVLLKHNEESNIALLGTAIGKVKAMKKLASTVIEKIDQKNEQTIYITHCNVIEDALEFKKLLINGGLKNKIEIYYYDLISGAHIGPGSLAVFYVAKKGQTK
ncbi:MAG: DegV family protein [Bacilli bacterium]|nr:DegV family protein [Bacilli bacterium]